MHMLYNTGLELYIGDWPSHHTHIQSRGQEITGICICLHTISMAVEIPVCMSMEDIRVTMSENAEL